MFGHRSSRRSPPPRTRSAALGSALYLVVAPGMVAGLGPWLVTGSRLEGEAVVLRILGMALIAMGLVVLLPAFIRFATEGRGTPAPVAPTERLVVGGSYRYVRNPMYLAVGGLILGQLLFFGQLGLLAYLLVYVVAVGSFVRLYEEPVLSSQFGASYDDYRRAVPAWLPRRLPWTPGTDD